MKVYVKRMIYGVLGAVVIVIGIIEGSKGKGRESGELFDAFVEEKRSGMEW